MTHSLAPPLKCAMCGRALSRPIPKCRCLGFKPSIRNVHLQFPQKCDQCPSIESRLSGSRVRWIQVPKFGRALEIELHAHSTLMMERGWTTLFDRGNYMEGLVLCPKNDKWAYVRSFGNRVSYKLRHEPSSFKHVSIRAEAVIGAVDYIDHHVRCDNASSDSDWSSLQIHSVSVTPANLRNGRSDAPTPNLFSDWWHLPRDMPSE